jgi:hypothetical protein
MPTACVMTAGFNIFVLALTPVERWKAARWFDPSFMNERMFILTGIATIIILTTLLLTVSYCRIIKERKVSEQLFFNNANKRGLSERECQILLEIAYKAELKRSESIFTMPRAFDYGTGKMVEESLTQQGTEESRWLRTEISFLREKLGFQKRKSASIGSSTKSNKPSSRQILKGKKLHITRRKTRELADIESTVINNDEMGIILKLTKPLESKPGESWRARYYFGASVWEFDTSVFSCNDDILVLNHSDNIRFVNRRRFLRVPVNKQALIAWFPFSKTLQPNSKKKYLEAKQNLANASNNTWGPPEFSPAIVTELGGPGLRIETQLEVKVGDRVVVILKLNEKKDRNSITSQDSIFVQDGKIKSLRIVEDIGQVRHVKVIQNGFSIAVELTGLSDSDLSELIRTANAALIRNNNHQDTPNFTNTEEKLQEPTVLQGV